MIKMGCQIIQIGLKLELLANIFSKILSCPYKEWLVFNYGYILFDKRAEMSKYQICCTKEI